MESENDPSEFVERLLRSKYDPAELDFTSQDRAILLFLRVLAVTLHDLDRDNVEPYSEDFLTGVSTLLERVEFHGISGARIDPPDLERTRLLLQSLRQLVDWIKADS